MINLQQFFMQESAAPVSTDTSRFQHGFIAPLSDFSLLQATGAEAANFLHNQLTNDVEHLGTGEARLAAYCSPKGRMLASIFFWKTDEAIFLQLSSTLQSTIQKRLQMFIMRAKAKLTDISAEYRMVGLGGEVAGEVLQQWFPQLPAANYAKVDNESGTLIRVADAFGFARYQWIAKTEILEQNWSILQHQLTAVNVNIWRYADILAGIPHIADMTQEKFVPQMVNFELIGGVNFKKGCYPGQEIVARSQYLGKLKRRMSIATIHSSEVQAGMEVFSANDASQPCGMIVNATLQDAQSSICLVEIKVADQEAGDIHLGSADGEALQFLPLPYPLLDVTQ